MRALCLLTLLAGAACSSAAPAQPPPSAASNKASAAAGAEASSAHAIPPGPKGQVARPSLTNDRSDPYAGTLDREGLVAIIDQGLGRLLQHVRLEPALSGGKFRGFRVASLDPAWTGTGLVAGDVITRVNGLPIERPEQALSAFESLRTASEVRVDLMRAGTSASLRYRIE